VVHYNVSRLAETLSFAVPWQEWRAVHALNLVAAILFVVVGILSLAESLDRSVQQVMPFLPIAFSVVWISKFHAPWTSILDREKAVEASEPD
jgi:hypothetical protein